MIYLTESELFTRSNEFLRDYFFKRSYEIGGEPVLVISVQHFANGLSIVYRCEGRRHVSSVSEFLDKTSPEKSSSLRLIKRRAKPSEQTILDF
jgi:hypothetical protein